MINPSALRLQLPSSLKVHTVFHMSQVKPVAISALSPPAPTPPPPRTLESGDLVWEVSRILAVRRHGRGFHYLMEWVGYGPEDRSWVPRSYLADPRLLRDFYRENPRAIRRSPGVSRREGGPVVDLPIAMPPTQVSSMRPRAGDTSPLITPDSLQLRRSSRWLQSSSGT